MNDSPFSLIAVFNAPEIGFKGNTASVVLLKSALPEDTMQRIAADFNQPATTFLWPAKASGDFYVRWFAPDAEIDLCGHGALAATAFLSEHLLNEENINLLYGNGKIKGNSSNGKFCTIYLDAIPILTEQEVPALLPQALGIPVKAFYETEGKTIVLTDNEKSIKNMRPDFALLRQLKTFGYAVTAPGEEVDFVSRTLVPHVRQLEDPATGSSHAVLVPFWAERLNKTNFIAHQLSPRGGKFLCGINKTEVSLKGGYTVFGKGKLEA